MAMIAWYTGRHTKQAVGVRGAMGRTDSAQFLIGGVSGVVVDDLDVVWFSSVVSE